VARRCPGAATRLRAGNGAGIAYGGFAGIGWGTQELALMRLRVTDRTTQLRGSPLEFWACGKAVDSLAALRFDYLAGLRRICRS
jgi:hypothetical protein